MWLIDIERITRRIVGVFLPRGSKRREWFVKKRLDDLYRDVFYWLNKGKQWLFLLQSEQTRHRKERQFFDQFCINDPVMIFSAGKVGSVSLNQSLSKSLGRNYPLVRIEKFPKNRNDKWGREIFFLVMPFRKLDYCEYLRSRYVRGDISVPEGSPGFGTRLKIISPIREPIGRDVSGFFQGGLWKHFGLKWEEIVNNPQSIEFMLALSNRELRDIYFSYYCPSERKKHSITVWYEKRLIPDLGIDVYAQPFPKERIAYYTTHKADLMMYDCSLDDEKQESLIKDFLGLDSFTMRRAHVTSEKSVVIRQLYERFKQEVRFPEWYLEAVFSSAYFRHFYTSQDEARLRRQWSEDS